MRYDVAIIGAGFSGLAAGIRLAHFGRRVCIVEKHSVWGGLNSFYKKDGRHFDTGLHAVTNWVRPGHKGARLPLQRIARQLRFDLAQLELFPQTHSEIRFGDATLRFSNDFALFDEEVRRLFPREIDGLTKLKAACAAYPDLSINTPHRSAKEALERFISDPLLREMLLAPILFYGSAEEEDIDFEQFQILFKSIYEEGFSRPKGGVRAILDVLVDKYLAAGGEMIKGTGVKKLFVEDGKVSEAVLDDGSTISADILISSAGLVETMRLRSDGHPTDYLPLAGQIGFLETIWVLDEAPKALGHEACVTFFSEKQSLRWAPPDDYIDATSGVICCPSNYDLPEGSTDPVIRATHLAGWRHWFKADEDAPTIPDGGRRSIRPQRSERYLEEKRRAQKRSLETVSRYTGDFAEHVVYADSFTPKTVRHFAQKENGAIYGSPHKQKRGTTDLQNLFLCGTDQGLAGIVGAMLSGINVANAYGLGATTAALDGPTMREVPA
jgi:phytoene dehydrogenase-like protein